MVQAEAAARAGDGPALIECATYRFDAHHTWEHVARPRYRGEDELARGRSRDPVAIQGERLPAAEREAIDAEIEQVLEDAVRFALESPRPDPADALEFLYADGSRPRAGALQ